MSKNLLIQGISVAKLPNILTNVTYRSAIMFCLRFILCLVIQNLSIFFLSLFFFPCVKQSQHFNFTTKFICILRKSWEITSMMNKLVIGEDSKSSIELEIIQPL